MTWNRLYVIRNVTAGTVKIGRSQDPEYRLAQLIGAARMCGYDPQFELVGSVPISWNYFERLIHQALSQSRVRNEWFAEDDAVRDFIATVITARNRKVPTWLVQQGVLPDTWWRSVPPALDQLDGRV